MVNTFPWSVRCPGPKHNNFDTALGGALKCHNDQEHLLHGPVEKGVPFFCWHDHDIRPEGATFAESRRNFDEMIGIFEKFDEDKAGALDMVQFEGALAVIFSLPKGAKVHSAPVLVLRVNLTGPLILMVAQVCRWTTSWPTALLCSLRPQPLWR